MNAGALKQRLTFVNNEGTDEHGYPIDEPIEYARAWGSLKTLKGRTRFLAAQSQMEHNREFTIRYQKKLEDANRPPNLKVKWKGQLHDIESIEPDDGLNVTMTVVLKAVT